jgi:hypothetical protein
MLISQGLIAPSPKITRMGMTRGGINESRVSRESERFIYQEFGIHDPESLAPPPFRQFLGCDATIPDLLESGVLPELLFIESQPGRARACILDQSRLAK